MIATNMILGSTSTVCNFSMYIYMGVVQKSFHFFQAFRRTFAKLSQAFARGFYHCRRKWFFVGARGFQGFMQLPWHVLCPLITDTLIAEEQEASQPIHFHVGVFLVGRNPP